MPRFFSRFPIAVLVVLLLSIQVAAAAEKGSGLPLPRFVSLRVNEVNMRTGPGVQYPVEWVYSRQYLPMEVVAEYNTWRKVRDWQGVQGWVHQSMLDGRRSFIVTGTTRMLRSAPSAKSKPVAQLETGVIGMLAECPGDGGWCRVEAAGRKGWLRRVDFWGVMRDEAIE